MNVPTAPDRTFIVPDWVLDYVMADTIRPQIAESDDMDINARVDEYASERGMTKKEAWSELVQRGLTCPSGADVTVVVDGNKIPQAIFSDEADAEAFAHKLVEELAKTDRVTGEAGWMTLTVDSTQEMEWAESATHGAEPDTPE